MTYLRKCTNQMVHFPFQVMISINLGVDFPMIGLVIRFVNRSNEICEEFLEFVNCSGKTTGKALAAIVITKLQNYNLNPELLRGQGYDGAGNMAGRVRGVAARIQKQFPKAFYVHCYSLKLNVVVMKLCEIVAIRNEFGKISRTAIF